MYLIELVMERYSYGGTSTKQIGYTEDEQIAKDYCSKKTKELEGTYNENMGCKYYQYRKLDLIE